MREFVVYTLLRLALFAGTFAVIAAIWIIFDDGFPIFPVLVIAFVVSGIASYFLLNGQRVAFASKVERRASAAVERSRTKEDVD